MLSLLLLVSAYVSLLLPLNNVLAFSFLPPQWTNRRLLTRFELLHRNNVMSNLACDNNISVVQELLTNQGVTSLDVLLSLPSTLTGATEDNTDDTEGSTIMLAAGTKKGNTVLFNLDVGKLHHPASSAIDVIISSQFLKDEGFQQKPYPIYSMRFFKTGDGKVGLACGGGDRFLTIWQVDDNVDEAESSSFVDVDWRVHAALGPHTGWVKDIAFDGLKDRLYSIGCNCIEAWGIDENTTARWRHLKKRAIESSPEGATLSSDLLCLTMANALDLGGSTSETTLFSAGVDGRIHVWSNDLTSKGDQQPLRSMRAHDGRVNAIATARLSTRTLFFSVSNDGTLQCRLFKSDNEDYFVDSYSTLCFGDDDMRIISMSCVTLAATLDCDERVLVALGTADGQFGIAEVRQSSSLDKNLPISMKLKIPLVRIDDGSIHAIVYVPRAGGDGEPSSVKKLLFAIGHSNGLSLISC